MPLCVVRCVVVDRRCRGSKGKAKIEGYMSISDEEAHHLFIMGGLRGTAFNVLEAHAYKPPVDLLVCKTQTHATTCICTLPTNHPLSTIARHAAKRFVNRHHSPLHYLFHQTQLNPLTTKHISTFCRLPFHKPTFKTKISPSKDVVLELTKKTHNSTKYKVYCDGSSTEGGVSAAAILYKNNWLIKTHRAYLGSADEHTVFEAELVGILLALSLLYNLSCQLIMKPLIGLDNQATLHTLNNEKTKPSHYLLDHIHKAVEKLNKKQDKIQNPAVFWNTCHTDNCIIAKLSGVVDLRLQWIPGHVDFTLNEKADAEAKRAARGQPSTSTSLPKLLRKSLLHSILALHQNQKAEIQRKWLCRWKASPRYPKQ